jgi:hypothetical protein
VGGGAVFIGRGGTATISSCSFKGGADDTVSVANGNGNFPPGTLTFGCVLPSSGAPVTFKENVNLEAGKLPPATEIAHCT